MTDLVRAHQSYLLETIWYSLGGRELAPRVRDAFLAVPRHLFVESYCTLAAPEFRRISPENLAEHLPALYSNNALGIHRVPGDPRVATISAPSIVLEMLELLDLSPGQRVFELGAGSGWNAALLGHLVAPGGVVETVEILPGMAALARRGLARARIDNVHVVLGDGSFGPTDGDALFDRAVFTAGASDLPASLFARVRPGGRLLFVLAIPGGGNVLVLFERRGAGFASLATRRCTFVPVTGQGSAAIAAAETLESLPGWPDLARRVVERRFFSVSPSGPTAMQDRSVDLRSYLWLVDPAFHAWVDAAGRSCFGLHDDTPASLALIRDSELRVFGAPDAGQRLLHHLHAWIELGMPSLADLELTALPVDAPAASIPPHRWQYRGASARFLFRLPSMVA